MLKDNTLQWKQFWPYCWSQIVVEEYRNIRNKTSVFNYILELSNESQKNHPTDNVNNDRNEKEELKENKDIVEDTNINRKEFKGVNLDTIQELVDNKKVNTITLETLLENGLVSKNDKIKILGSGTLSVKLQVKAHAFSKSAKEAIEKLLFAVKLIKLSTQKMPSTSISKQTYSKSTDCA